MFMIIQAVYTRVGVENTHRAWGRLLNQNLHFVLPPLGYHLRGLQTLLVCSQLVRVRVRAGSISRTERGLKQRMSTENI